MQTRREYLVGLGLAKAGRGKLSRAAHEAIDAAVAKGMEFSDLQDKPVTVKRERKSKPAKAESVTEDRNNYAEAQLFHPWDQKFKGTDSKGKSHTVSVRAACYDGRYSIMGCPLRTHRVIVGGGEVITVSPIGE